MEKSFRSNSIVVGSLFILTMLAGMIDAYFVSPLLQSTLADIPTSVNLLQIGVFSIVFMALGVVAIATALFPVVKRHSEAIALTYVSFRVIECLLLLVGSVLYLLILGESSADLSINQAAEGNNKGILAVASMIKSDTYQLSMLILGSGSVLLNASFYVSRVIPRWLSVWGIFGYLLLAISAILALLGVASAIEGGLALLYIPGGLWELFVFPVWLIVKGFRFGSE